MMKASGRPRLREGETARQVRVTMTQDDKAYLAAIGGGNRSYGVRRCIEWHKITYGLDRLGGGFIMLRKDYEPFMARCEQEGKNPATVLAQLIEGYVTMPTPDEVRAALERGPQHDVD